MLICIGLVLLAAAAVTDVKTQKIPLPFIAASALCALIACITGGDVREAVLSVLPGAALILLSFFSRESVGYGDGMLMMCAGPVFGLQKTLCGVMLAFFATAVVSVVLLVCKKAGRKTRMPFVPFLASAMGVVTVALA